jgi:hypothetical protein
MIRRTLAYAQCWNRETGSNFTIYHIYQEGDTITVHYGVRDTGERQTIELPEELWRRAVERYREDGT